MDTEKIKQVENILGVTFKDKDVLQSALVHRSYLNEHPSFGLPHNERLEFLGDAVLELVVTEHLFRNYPNPEGELTNWRSALVKTESLHEISSELGINNFLLMSKGEQKSEGRSRTIILANAFEAVVGAIFLDLGMEAAREFITEKLVVKLKHILEAKLYIDPKSQLQELTQEHDNVTPQYKVLEESGPDHDKLFRVGVFLGTSELGRGEGHSKQEAQQNAAIEALKNYLR